MNQREFIKFFGPAAIRGRLPARRPERVRRIGVLLPAMADDAVFQARLGVLLRYADRCPLRISGIQ
jgi:hypothetical protein